jgi:hypothetical protein
MLGSWDKTLLQTAREVCQCQLLHHLPHPLLQQEQQQQQWLLSRRHWHGLDDQCCCLRHAGPGSR